MEGLNNQFDTNNIACRSGRLKVCVIGAGNVAGHLAPALAKVADVVQVVSRTGISGSALRDRIGAGCEAITDLEQLTRNADLYLISATDDSVASIVAHSADFGGVWVHTSGSVPASVFAGKRARYGVLYPLQTFTRNVDVNMSRVPFFVEGNDEATTEFLREVALKISNVVEIADSERRKKLHLAAVFACNFANQMWVEADSILREIGLSINYLMPLLQVTLSKLDAVTPRDAMTGPARRGDLAVIEAQREQLSGTQQAIYTMLSNRILSEFDHSK